MHRAEKLGTQLGAGESVESQYERDGYVVVRGLFSEAALATFREEFERLCDGRSPVPDGMLVMRDVAIKGRKVQSSRDVTKVQDFHENSVLFEFCRHPEMMAMVQRLTGSDNVRSIHSMLINKPPDEGLGTSRHPLHQDLNYFPLRPEKHIVATWVAMEPVSRKNGCLCVVPGSHKLGLLPHGVPQWEGGANFLYHGIVESDKLSENRVHLEMAPGDCVFFHPMLVHGSGRNTTKGFRKAISAHFASGTLCRFTDVPQSLISEMFAKQPDIPASFHQPILRNHWRLKSRQIVGQPQPEWNPEEMDGLDAF